MTDFLQDLTLALASTDALAIFLVSFLTCLVIVLLGRRRALLFARPEHMQGQQAIHSVVVPRVGGIAILLGCLGAVASGPQGVTNLLMALCIGAPILVVGLDEDIGRGASPRERLFAVGLSGAIAIAVLQLWVDRIGIGWADPALQNIPVATVFTLFLVVGTSHAFNIIDGLNGLCVGVAMVSAGGLAVLAHLSGDMGVMALLVLLVPAFGGFLVWNFPNARIFLGDTGAYLVGFVLAWCGIALIDRNAEISAWAVFLVMFWPIAEMLSSMLRRAVQRRRMSDADTGHVHHLIFRALRRALSHRANPVAALLVTLAAAGPATLGVLRARTAGPIDAMACFAIFGLLVLFLHRRVPTIDTDTPSPTVGKP